MTKFNTAIFYDIENLIKGYGNYSSMSNVSLKKIYEDIRRITEVGGVAVQRAYANWSDSRLGVMKGDIVELGIDPIQVFGFSRDNKKNAADIQLAVEATDLAHTKPAIEVFVIVSGDGGFASLAKKLHEYGKIVIGCAYKKGANRIFESVCDEFIWIDEPDIEEEQQVANDRTPDRTTVSIIDRMSTTLSPIDIKNEQQLIDESKKVIVWLSKDEASKPHLGHEGLNISIVKQLLRHRIRNFSYLSLGFTRFADFLRFICKGTALCVALRPPSDYRVANGSFKFAGFSKLEPVDRGNIHTAPKYKELLAYEQPLFRIPSPSAVTDIANYLASLKIEEMKLEDLLLNLQSRATGYEQLIIKQVVQSFISAKCFYRKPDDVHISEQFFTLKFSEPMTLIEQLKTEMRGKLISLLGRVDESEFDKLLAAP